MTKDNDFDGLEKIVAKAHAICNKMLLFEAIEMEEDEVRLFLACNHVADPQLQERYLEFVRQYAEETGGRNSEEDLQ
jgi:DNA repair photolyase